MGKTIKKIITTYSKKKNNTKGKNPTVININVVHQVTNIKQYHVNNFYNFSNFSNNSGSCDEFDKLLKGPIYNQQTTSFQSFGEIKNNVFQERRSFVFYNSDVSTGSSGVSTCLFKDTKDLCDPYSTSWLLTTPPSYEKKNNKLMVKRLTPVCVKKKRIYRKKNTKFSVLYKKVPSKYVVPEGAFSSTPTHTNVAPHKSKLNSFHLSPITPGISTPVQANPYTDSVSDLFGDEDNQENRSDDKENCKALGMTDLLQNLDNLALSTPHAKPKDCVRTDFSVSTPSVLNIRNNHISERTLRSSTKKIQHHNEEKEILRFKNLGESIKKNTPETSLSLSGMLETFDINKCVNIKRRTTNKRCKNVFAELNTDSNNRVYEHKDSGCLELEPSFEKVCLGPKESKGSKEDSVHTKSSVRSCVKEKLRSDMVDFKTPICERTPSQTDYTSPALSRQSISPEPEDPKIHLEKLKNRFNLIPGKSWRRSFIRQKQTARGRECSEGPAVLAKLVKRGNLTLTINMSRDSNAQNCLNQVKDSDKNIPRVDHSIVSCDTSKKCDLSFNNMPQLLKNVAFRTKMRESNVLCHPTKCNKGMDNILEENQSIECEGFSTGIPNDNKSNVENFQITPAEIHQNLNNLSTTLMGIKQFNRPSAVKLDTLQLDSSYINPVLDQINEKGIVNRHSFHTIENPTSEKATLDLSGELKNNSRQENLEECQVSESSHSASNYITENKCYTENSVLESENAVVHQKNANLLDGSASTPSYLKLNVEDLGTVTKRKKTFTKSQTTTLATLDLSQGSSEDEDVYFDGDRECKSLPAEESRIASEISFIDTKDLHQLLSHMDDQELFYMGKQEVLRVCGLENPLSFSDGFPDEVLASSKKIGEGVYGEVFMVNRPGNRESVVKIIPVEGSQLVNGEPQKKFYEVLSELTISEQLSSLRQDLEFNTSGFCELKGKLCLQGEYPSKLIDLWKEYDIEKRSDNDCPDKFGHDQLYLSLELDHAGESVESFKFNTAKQAYSVFLQTACSLAVAEASLEFEHRDLHVGNVLVKPTKTKYIDYVLRGFSFKLPSYGIKSTIIDFTLSRISFDGDVLYFDLAKDPELFTSESEEYQFEIYRLMRKDLNNIWINHEPMTNIRWLHYLIDKFLKQVVYDEKAKSKKAKEHTQYLKKMTALKDMLLDFNSSFDLAEFLTQTHQDTLCIIKTSK